MQRSTDRYTLRWTHSAERFEAFHLFSQLYEAQTSGPKCMYPGNIALHHQVALADLKSCKAALSKSAARGGGGDGTSRRSNNAGRRYTQQAVAPRSARRAWWRCEYFRCQERRRCRRGWRPFVMPPRGQARRGVSFPSSTSAIDMNQNVAPPSPSGEGGHALRKVSFLSSSHALDLQARSLAKNVKRVGPRKLSRMPLDPCATRWFPGRGRLLSGPRSAGTFYSSKVKASLAWWMDPVQSTPLTVLRWISQGVKVEFRLEFRPLSLAPREVHPSEIPFILADQEKGR